MEQLTKEQEKALALAKARRRRAEAEAKAAEAPPENSEVARQAAIKGPAGVADAIATGVYTAPQMIYGAGATALGRPDLAPNIEKPVTAVSDFFYENPDLPPSLRTSELENMTPGQEILDTAVQGATTGMLGRGKMLANAALGALGGAAGEATAQATGSEVAGLGASILAPGAAAKYIKPLNAEKRLAQLDNAERDAILKEASKVGISHVPESKLADYANRPKLLDAVDSANRTKVNQMARATLGLPKESLLNIPTLKALRNREYAQGYLPLKNLGRNALYTDPVTGLNPYLEDLINIKNAYSGSKGSFPAAVPKQLDEIVDKYVVNDMDASDVVDKVRQLREEASKALNSPASTPEGEQLAFAKKEIANALENELERQAVQAGIPSLVDNYKKARKQIAKSHLVEDAMDPASEVVNPEKLGKLYVKGVPIDGDLATAAKFYALDYGRRGAAHNEPISHFYKAAAGMSIATAAGTALGLSPQYTAMLALGGAAGTNLGAQGVQGALRKYLTSGVGQQRSMPNYTGMGTEPAIPALSGMGYFGSLEEEQK
jgi:hypothetical protein